MEEIKQPKNSKKIIPYIIVLLMILLIATLMIVYFFILKDRPADNDLQEEVADQQTEDNIKEEETEEKTEKENAIWEFKNDKWTVTGTPSDCPDPLLIPLPVDLDLVTGTIYPGQNRGSDFKAHGGFRFDGLDSDDITVTAPFDATVYKGAAYIQEGEIQYWFDFIMDCGLMYRFDHLFKLDGELAEAVKVLTPKVNDSSTTVFSKPVEIKAGDIISTAVGFPILGNIFVDFGFYDLRQVNEFGMGQTLNHMIDKESDFYGICWLDYIDPDEAKILRSLPTGLEGKFSEYCDK